MIGRVMTLARGLLQKLAAKICLRIGLASGEQTAEVANSRPRRRGPSLTHAFRRPPCIRGPPAERMYWEIK
jgi:hypothetical protein